MKNPDVLVFTRMHGSAPTIISHPDHIRVNYGDVWIDFKGGAVIASDNDFHEIFNLPANLKNKAGGREVAIDEP